MPGCRLASTSISTRRCAGPCGRPSRSYTRQAMPRHVALAYLSAAADFEISQLVDAVKGVHCVIRKRDLADW
jgi:hypothetical protein